MRRKIPMASAQTAAGRKRHFEKKSEWKARNMPRRCEEKRYGGSRLLGKSGWDS